MQKNKFLELKPMLLKEIEKPFNDKNYLYEIKFDGFRAFIYINKKEIIIKSRNGIILNDVFPELLEIKNLIKQPCILDGEIVYFEEGKPNIRVLQERMRTKDKVKTSILQAKYPTSFVCFDILDDGKDLTNLPLLKRKEILAQLPENEYFQKTKFYLEKGKELFKAIKKEHLEGIVAKKIDSKYYYGKRVDDWLKIKNIQSDYFYIGGFNKNKNNTISLYLGEKQKKNFIFVGKMSISIHEPIYKQVIKAKIINNSPFTNYENKKCIYIKPRIDILVYYIEKTKNGMLRHPHL